MARRRVMYEQELPVPLTLRALRKRQGLRQEDVGRALGVNRDAVSKYETGLIQVQVRYLPTLAHLYRVPLEVVLRAVLPRNGHGEEKTGPERTWETRVRSVLKSLVALEKEKETQRG